MRRPEIEEDGVARFHLPFEDFEGRILVGIGNRQIVSLGRVEIAVVEPAHRQDHLVPFVGTGDQPQSGFLHRIDRNPEADGLPAVDEIIRDVLVPRRRLLGARFLDQHVIVEELRAARAHDRGRELGGRRFPHHAHEFGNAFPIAIIVEEAAAPVGDVRSGGASILDVAFDTVSDDVDPFLECTANADGAVALIGIDCRGIDEGLRSHHVLLADAGTMTSALHPVK